MSRRIPRLLLPAACIAAALVVAAPGLAPADSPKLGHKPDEVNPVWRSWQFTSKGDTVEYTVEGVDEYDRERRMFRGTRDGKYMVEVSRTKGGEAVSKNLEAVVVENKPEGRQFAEFYRKNAFTVSFVARRSGDVPFPCMKLDSPLSGTYIFSEDVPLGGLVRSEDPTSGVVRELAGFRREQMPPPSERALEASFTSDEPAISVSSVRTEKAKGRAAAKDTGPVVRSLGTTLREDAESTPTYFMVNGTPTKVLAELAYLHASHHLTPGMAMDFSVARTSETIPEDNHEYSLRVMVAEVPDLGWFALKTVSKPRGKLPDGIVPDVETIEPIVPDAFPMRTIPTLYLGERAPENAPRGTPPQQHYVMLEGPFVERGTTETGTETQEVLRRRHDVWLTKDIPPIVNRWETYERFYYHEAGERDRILDSSFEAFRHVVQFEAAEALPNAVREANVARVEAWLAAQEGATGESAPPDDAEDAAPDAP